MTKTLYDLLEVLPNAQPAVIKASYRALAQKYHPDKNPDKHAEELFKSTRNAYEILSDPHKRKNYDAFLASQAYSQSESEARARKESEAHARKDAEDRRREAEDRARKEAEAHARKDAEDRRREAEDRARKEAEAHARKDAEDRARKEADDHRWEAEYRSWQEADDRAWKEAKDRHREDWDRAQKEAKAHVRKEAEERRREAWDSAGWEADAPARKKKNFIDNLKNNYLIFMIYNFIFQPIFDRPSRLKENQARARREPENRAQGCLRRLKFFLKFFLVGFGLFIAIHELIALLFKR